MRDTSVQKKQQSNCDIYTCLHTLTHYLVSEDESLFPALPLDQVQPSR